MKLIRKLPFIVLLALILVMAVATFVEKELGTSFAYTYVYGAWWFSALWGVLVAFGIFGIIKGKIYKNLPLFLLHISFIVILAGALFTKLFSTQGRVVLNQHYLVNTMYTSEGKIQSLPFQLKLENFYIDYYPGTDSPADYVSQLEIIDQANGETIQGKVSMNNIMSYKGYRFYQSSYENDGQTSVLSVNRDILGIPFTYAGYALFALSMIGLLFSKKNKFRQLLSHPALKKAAIFLLLLLPASTYGNVLTDDRLTVNKQQAEAFGKLWMLYDGRITPVSTFARDFTLKLTGKPKFSYLNSEQFLMSFLFLPETWQKVAIFEIENQTLLDELGLKAGEKAALNDFFDQTNHYKLAHYWDKLIGSEKSPLIKEVEKINEKIQLINMLHSGNLLQLYPIKTDGQLLWLYPTQDFPESVSPKDSAFIKASLVNYHTSLVNNDENGAFEAIQAINNFQQSNAKELLPSDTKRNVEVFYTKFNVTSVLFMANLALGVLALLSLFIFRGRKADVINTVFIILLGVSFLVHTVSIGLRTYIGGRLPFSNGYETMLLIAWCAMLLALVFSRKIKLIIPFGFLVSGCALLVAHISMKNPQITQLVPVLSSPLLSIHVSTIMISYTLFAFIALNGLVSLLQIAFSTKNNRASAIAHMEQNKMYSLLCFYPAMLFLGAGIFVGAIWANVSWGRYWGWDPKETWALITFLVYSFVLHEKSIPFLSKPFSFHVFGLLAISTVLMTYFGVNYFLGGMHSYAGEISMSGTWLVIGGVAVVLAALITAAYLKYKKITPNP